MKSERILVVKTEDFLKEFGEFEGFMRVNFENFLNFLDQYGFSGKERKQNTMKRRNR